MNNDKTSCTSLLCIGNKKIQLIPLVFYKNVYGEFIIYKLIEIKYIKPGKSVRFLNFWTKTELNFSDLWMIRCSNGKIELKEEMKKRGHETHLGNKGSIIKYVLD